MSNTSDQLDSASGRLFFLGMILIKAKYIPHVLISSILNLVALSVYLLGYFLWFLATLFHKNHPKVPNKWYGFAAFKEQFQLSSVIGLVATILCIAFPVLVLPAAWLFFISNVFWLIGFYQKQNTHDLDNKEMTPTQEAFYFRYVVLMTAASLIAAIATTIALIIPPISVSVLGIAAVIGLLVSIVGMVYLVKSYRSNKGSELPKQSYERVSDRLDKDRLLNPRKPSLDNDEMSLADPENDLELNLPLVGLEQSNENLYSPNVTTLPHPRCRGISEMEEQLPVTILPEDQASNNFSF